MIKFETAPRNMVRADFEAKEKILAQPDVNVRINNSSDTVTELDQPYQIRALYFLSGD